MGKESNIVDFVINMTPEIFCAGDYYEIDKDGNVIELVPYEQWPVGLKRQFS